MNNEIIVRKVTDGDFDGLVKLYEEVWPDVSYNKEDKARFILQESSGIKYCAELNGEIVGSRTSFDLNFYFGKRKLNCIEYADSCTREDSRGKGLFGRMNKALLADFFSEEYGGQLIWNIGVIASRRVYERIGWNYIESLQTIVKFARPFHILGKVGLNIRSLGGDVEWDLSNDEPVITKSLLETRENLLRTDCKLHVHYDESTFYWRMKSRSGIKFFDAGDIGCIVYKIGMKKGLKIVMIGEIFLAEYNHEHLTNILKEFQNAINPDVLKSSISIGHPLYDLYSKVGFRKLHFVNHGVRVESEEMKKICYEPTNWAISMLDVDTF